MLQLSQKKNKLEVYLIHSSITRRKIGWIDNRTYWKIVKPIVHTMNKKKQIGLNKELFEKHGELFDEVCLDIDKYLYCVSKEEVMKCPYRSEGGFELQYFVPKSKFTIYKPNGEPI